MDSGLRALGYRDVGVGSQSRYLVEADILVISFHRRKHTKLRFRVGCPAGDYGMSQPCVASQELPCASSLSGGDCCHPQHRYGRDSQVEQRSLESANSNPKHLTVNHDMLVDQRTVNLVQRRNIPTDSVFGA